MEAPEQFAFLKKNKAKSQVEQELWWPMPQGLPKVSLK